MRKFCNIFTLSILCFGMQLQEAFAKKNEEYASAIDVYTPVLRLPESNHIPVEKKACWIAPDYVKVQFLKRSGHISAGAGYNIQNFYEPTLLVGYMYKQLESKDGKAPVITLKNSFTILGKNTSMKYSLKGGVSLNYSLGETTPENLSLYQRASYYFREKFYSTPFIGGEYYLNKNSRRVSIFAEISTVDSYLKDSFTSEFVQFDEIWAFRLGFTIYLRPGNRGY